MALEKSETSCRQWQINDVRHCFSNRCIGAIVVNKFNNWTRKYEQRYNWPNLWNRLSNRMHYYQSDFWIVINHFLSFVYFVRRMHHREEQRGILDRLNFQLLWLVGTRSTPGSNEFTVKGMWINQVRQMWINNCWGFKLANSRLNKHSFLMC